MTMTFRKKNGFLIFFKVVYGSTHKTDGIKWSRIFDPSDDDDDVDDDDDDNDISGKKWIFNFF